MGVLSPQHPRVPKAQKPEAALGASGEVEESCMPQHPQHVWTGKSWEELDRLESGGKPCQPLSCPYFLLWVFFTDIYICLTALSFHSPRKEKG